MASFYFFLEKNDDLFSHRHLESDDLFKLLSPHHSYLPTSFYIVYFLNSAPKFNFIRVSPLDGVPPLVTPLSSYEETDQNSESYKLETLTVQVHITMVKLINQKLRGSSHK